MQALNDKIASYETNLKSKLNDDQIDMLLGNHVKNWSDESVQKGLAFRYRMGQTLYNDVTKIAFLPSTDTLNRRIRHVEFNPGVCSNFCEYMGVKSEGYSKIERHGALIMDECAILEGIIFLIFIISNFLL